MSGLAVNLEWLGESQDVALLHLEGYIDANTSPVLLRALSRLIEDRHYKIICLLEKVNYVSSAGWGVFIGEITRLRHAGGDLKLVALGADVEEVYRALEFNVILKQFDTVDEALHHFN
jgi:anti-sigma B factor antagonist